MITRTSDKWILHKDSNAGNDFIRCGARCAMIGGKNIATVEISPGAAAKDMFLANADNNTICFLMGVSDLRDTFWSTSGFCKISLDDTYYDEFWVGASYNLHFQPNEGESSCSVRCIGLIWDFE